MQMIKQIVEFSRPGDDGAAEIELFVFTDEPAQTDEEIKKLIEMGATIDDADADTIRATIKATTQGRLEELLNDGWSFDEDKKIVAGAAD